jgi:hypothetical protein
MSLKGSEFLYIILLTVKFNKKYYRFGKNILLLILTTSIMKLEKVTNSNNWLPKD